MTVSIFLIFLSLLSSSSLVAPDSSHRRILHQPLFPVSSTSPPPDVIDASPPPPPAPVAPAFPSPDQPFFPEVPSTASSAQAQPPPPVAASSNGRIPMATATEPARPVKKVAIAVSVGIVTLGMLSAFAFFLYRHRAKHQGEGQKLVGGGDSRRFQEDSSVPPSTFLYIGTVEPSRTTVSEPNGANDSPYHKLNSVKRSDRYRPSPELQPLPPLPNPPPGENWPAAMSASSSDEESHGTAFYTPQGSTVSTEDSFHSSLSRSVNRNGGSSSVPRSKRTSPKSRIPAASPEMKHVIIPSIKPQVPPRPPPMPKPFSHEDQLRNSPEEVVSASKRAKFSAPPPPPNMALLRAISSSSPQRTSTPPPPPPPPPLPPPAIPTPKKGSGPNGVSPIPSQSLKKAESVRTPSPRRSPDNRLPRKSSEGIQSKNVSSSERSNGDESEGSKPRLKPLHWDKVRATADRATVWDQLKSSSFQLNEDMMESLFGCNPTNTMPKEPARRSVLPPVEQENRVLDPKKSQNIAIQLRALNVTREEVFEALSDGNPDSLGADLLEKLVKMAPTKEEEIKLREYKGDMSKLGSAERFLKSVLDIPFAFKRVEALLYRANFEAEVKYLRKAFQTLEVASEELKNSRLFLKLLEAVLRTGNRMNVGTNRGDAKAFKLETLLKLVDIKGTDGKTTLLHFVVQEIIRSEGADVSGSNGGTENNSISNMKESEFKKQGLQVVAGLSKDLSNVKKAAAMDSDVLSSYVSKLEKGLDTVRSALQFESSDMQGKFFQSMKHFMKDAEEEIVRVKRDERKALLLVKEVTEYFHGDAAKEEAHPLRIFMIVRDFLSILDHVCKDVGQMQDRTVIGSARSFRISATASLPVLTRYNARQYSSDEDSSSP